MTLIRYIFWHYFIAPQDIWVIFGNYQKSLWHRFLITQHLKTLLAPWHRQNPSDIKKSRTLADKALDSMIDFYIRIIAAVIRLLIVVTGAFAQVFIVIFFALLSLVWIMWPFVVVACMIKGILLIL